MVATPISTHPAPAPSGRVMIMNIGRIGDTILRNSIIDPAVRTFATVDYICSRHNLELLRHDPRLGRITVLHKTPKGWADVVKVALGRRYDVFIDLKGHASHTTLLVASMFRSRLKVGGNRGPLRPFHRETVSVNVPAIHILERMKRISQMAGMVPGEFKPSLFLPQESVEWFAKTYATLPRPFIFFNISATNPERLWPVENWVRYLRGCGLAGRAILVNGVAKDAEKVRWLCDNLPGTTAFRPRCFMDVAAAIQASALVVTVDTGVVQAASAFDKPTIGFYTRIHFPHPYESISTWRLAIRPDAGGVPEIQPDDAIRLTLEHGLQGLF